MMITIHIAPYVGYGDTEGMVPAKV